MWMRGDLLIRKEYHIWDNKQIEYLADSVIDNRLFIGRDMDTNEIRDDYRKDGFWKIGE